MKPGTPSRPTPIPRSTVSQGAASSGVRSLPTPPPGSAASQALKDQICEMALGILEEQVQARIVLYKAELETNRGFAAITAAVVEQLKELQATARAPRLPKDGIRDAQIRLLGDSAGARVPQGRPVALD